MLHVERLPQPLFINIRNRCFFLRYMEMWRKKRPRRQEVAMSKLTELQERIGYTFRREGLLRQALTHSSYANEKHMKKLSDNERLEFLGDAVLEVVSSEFLYQNYPKLPEGDLTKLRASIVCEPTLALCTRELALGDYLYLGRGEDQTGGSAKEYSPGYDPCIRDAYQQ